MGHRYHWCTIRPSPTPLAMGRIFEQTYQNDEIISELNTSWTLLKTSSFLQGAPSLDFGILFTAIDRVDLAIKRWEEIELDKRVFVYVENFSAAQESLIQTSKEATRTFVDQSDYSKEV
jgi:hypothetical protein